MEKVTRLVVACGGTGGHLYPGIAVARAFQKANPKMDVLFVGTAAGMESRVVPRQGFRFEAVASSGFLGKGILDRIKSLGRVSRGIFQAMGILRRTSPQIVVGVGGYASVPAILGAALLRIPRVILEPNVRPGLANRVMAPFCSLVIAAFEGTRKHLGSNRVAVLGVPIRPELIDLTRKTEKKGWTLLILGGSQGARAINGAVVEMGPILKERDLDLTIIHQTGKSDVEMARKAYSDAGLPARVEPFIEDMAAVYAEADLVIARSGAATVAELAVVGLPSILIPFPYAAGHQEDNARELEGAGGARVVLQGDLTAESLAKEVLSLLGDPAALREMGEAARRLGKPRAAEAIVEACEKLVKEKHQ